ncbi:hypothetical protein FRC08_018612 [Ceratobasidium sp. 394]|nr:hypothetical protein FRC08_018612 [Ceratobasidium sp. 394]
MAITWISASTLENLGSRPNHHDLGSKARPCPRIRANNIHIGSSRALEYASLLSPVTTILFIWPRFCLNTPFGNCPAVGMWGATGSCGVDPRVLDGWEPPYYRGTRSAGCGVQCTAPILTTWHGQHALTWRATRPLSLPQAARACVARSALTLSLGLSTIATTLCFSL